MKLNIFVILACGTLACGGGSEDMSPVEETSLIQPCGAPGEPLFDTLPVADAAIGEVIVFGELDPGGLDVVPNSQGGIRLAGQGLSLVAPGDAILVGVRSSTWLESDFREGETDFSVTIKPCQEVTASFAHVTTLEPEFEALLADAHCEEYTAGNELIHDCVLLGLEVPISAGQSIGTVGGATAGGFDFDMVDTRSVANVSPRLGEHYANAVCFSEYYDDANRLMLESRTGLLGEIRDGNPACGTIEVDIPGTMQGVWVKAEEAANDEIAAEAFITLAPDFIRTGDTLAISLGDPLLSPLVRVINAPSGRVNHEFSTIEEDGLIYCYGDNDSTVSIFLALYPDQELRIEQVAHGLGETPCTGEPDDWSFTGAAVDYVR